MSTRVMEISGADVVPFDARTAINRDQITINPEDLTLSAQPGEEVTQSITLLNDADSIPSDDDWLCVRDIADGIKQTLTLTVEQPVGEVDEEAWCLLSNQAALRSYTFTAPQEPGTYTMSWTSTWHNPPQVWANFVEYLEVSEDAGGGGGFDPSQVSASCSLRSSQIEEGEIGIIDVTLVNNNSQSASIDASILANGSILSTDTVPVGANNDISYQTSVRDLSVGQYDIEVATSASAAAAGASASPFGISRVGTLGCDTC